MTGAVGMFWYRGDTMKDENSLIDLLASFLWPDDVRGWMRALPPLGIPLALYIIYIITMGIEPRGLYIAYGVWVVFIGLECYWIVRGWLDDHASTIVMGVIGIAIALYGLNSYTPVA